MEKEQVLDASTPVLSSPAATPILETRKLWPRLGLDGERQEHKTVVVHDTGVMFSMFMDDFSAFAARGSFNFDDDESGSADAFDHMFNDEDMFMNTAGDFFSNNEGEEEPSVPSHHTPMHLYTAPFHPTPANERERVAKLTELNTLSSAEPEFLSICAEAKQICRTPIALVSLVTSDVQIFKGCIGLDTFWTPRRVSFCSFAICSEDPSALFIVPDARLDPRFQNNSLVTGPPHIVFYCGATIMSDDGFALGTLCVIDNKSRVLTDEQQAQLKDLARRVYPLIVMGSEGTLPSQIEERNKREKSLEAELEECQMP